MSHLSTEPILGPQACPLCETSTGCLGFGPTKLTLNLGGRYGTPVSGVSIPKSLIGRRWFSGERTWCIAKHSRRFRRRIKLCAGITAGQRVSPLLQPHPRPAHHQQASNPSPANHSAGNPTNAPTAGVPCIGQGSLLRLFRRPGHHLSGAYIMTPTIRTPSDMPARPSAAPRATPLGPGHEPTVCIESAKSPPIVRQAAREGRQITQNSVMRPPHGANSHPSSNSVLYYLHNGAKQPAPYFNPAHVRSPRMRGTVRGDLTLPSSSRFSHSRSSQNQIPQIHRLYLTFALCE